jgi:secondary thiamine-phosphate synthase enzyme
LISKIDIKTHSRVEFRDITNEVREIVKENNVNSGVCHVFVPHTTAGITINEHADPDVVEDIAAQLEEMVPHHHGYKHSEGNSAAHIKASLMGSSVAVMIERGNLALGTWQGIFFCEFDGPRNRTFRVKIISDGK